MLSLLAGAWIGATADLELNAHSLEAYEHARCLRGGPAHYWLKSHPRGHTKPRVWFVSLAACHYCTGGESCASECETRAASRAPGYDGDSCNGFEETGPLKQGKVVTSVSEKADPLGQWPARA